MRKLDENVKSVPEADWLRKGENFYSWNNNNTLFVSSWCYIMYKLLYSES